MKLVKSVLIAAALCVAPVKVFAADVALLIANVNEANIREPQTVNRELGGLITAYQQDGYTVIFEREVNSRQLLDAVARFEAQSKGADRLVVHFVGALSETRQSQFMMPNGATAGSIVELHRSALDVELVYDLLSLRPGRNALILGTATPRVVEKLLFHGHIPQGVLVVAGDALNINRSVQQGMLEGGESPRQLGQRTGVATLGYVSDVPLAATLAPQNNTQNRQQNASEAALVEMRDWQQAAQTGSRAALEGYLNRYPSGLFRGEAQARLNALAPAKPVEQTVEENLSLSRADRRRIQRNLTQLGFNTRGVDGVFGRGSRSAIERWQRSEGFRATGFLDGTQVRVLNEKARVKAEADRVAREREDLNYWQQTGSGSSVQGLQDYLARFPEGLFSAQAKQALERAQQNNQTQQNQGLLQRENALNMNGQTRALVEQRLTGLGYSVGPVDGNFTNETRIAIRDFQQKAGITPTGYMDNQTVTRLVASIFR